MVGSLGRAPINGFRTARGSIQLATKAVDGVTGDVREPHLTSPKTWS